jgi:hypothetical protein
MGKKNTNAAAKAAKKAKAQAKTERKEKKKVLGGGKAGGAKGKGKAEDDDEDLEAILDKVSSIWIVVVWMVLTLFVRTALPFVGHYLNRGHLTTLDYAFLVLEPIDPSQYNLASRCDETGKKLIPLLKKYPLDLHRVEPTLH